jgi:hypothetical protein
MRAETGQQFVRLIRTPLKCIILFATSNKYAVPLQRKRDSLFRGALYIIFTVHVIHHLEKFINGISGVV